MRRYRRLTLITDVVVITACVAAFGLWFTQREWPSVVPDALNGLASDPPDDSHKKVSLPTGPFAIDLWHEPPPEPVKAPRQPKPLPRLILIGIRRTDQGYVAMIKDNVNGEIARIRSGDQFAEIDIERVDPSGVFGTFDGRGFELLLSGGRP
ncbi:MAG: hypothetical protein AAGA55_08905 [Planctomycetota bacterium]